MVVLATRPTEITFLGARHWVNVHVAVDVLEPIVLWEILKRQSTAVAYFTSGGYFTAAVNFTFFVLPLRWVFRSVHLCRAN